MIHFVSILDHDEAWLEKVLASSSALKARMKAGIPDRKFMGKTLGMFFDKPSTRTLVSLEVAITSMGGAAIDCSGETRLGQREAVNDVARVMSRYVNVVAIRTFGHEVVRKFAANATVPVINALSDYSHPTQAMADVMTMREHLGDTRGRKLAFIGDGNNVARSLASVCGRLGISFAIASPKGFELDEPFRMRLAKECPGMDFIETNDPAAAVKGADVVYTDVWASMGQEGESQERLRSFSAFQVNSSLMAKAPAGCLVMHCLPAHRGEEIADDVLESKASIVFDQAENRMHFYRGLFAELLPA